MKKLILSLIFGIFLSVSHLGAQEVEVPVSSKDTTEVVQTIKLKFEKPRASNVNVRYENVLESLTEEQINRIITTLEERGDASVEMFISMGESMMILSSILEEKAFMDNKIIYQADKHYDLSESEVKRSLRHNQWLQLFAYGLIFMAVISAIRRTHRGDIFVNGYIELNKLISILLIFALEAFVIWYIVKPVASIVINRDYEIIKFLLQGA